MTNNSVSKATDSGALRFDWNAFFDVIIVVAVLVAVKQFFLLYTIKYAGPASTFTAMAVATWRLRARGHSWGDLGFKSPESWLRTIAISLFVFAVVVAFGVVGSTVADLFFERGYVANRFGDIEGDVVMYLVWMALVWTHGAFFEEMLFRAFLINRLGKFLGGSAAATILSVVLAAIFFGYRHAYYQGAYGFVVTGTIGLGLGIIYVWFGKSNLLPQILAHGYMNSLGFTMRFLGLRG